MSLHEYKTNLPYGVINTKNTKVIAWNEKPELKVNINMGCYVMEPGVMRFIPKNKPFGMDDVIKKAMSKKLIVSSFISKNGFIDIGNKESYRKANEEFIQKLGKI
jgi:mannose-1-phosphate guanylyltransferase